MTCQYHFNWFSPVCYRCFFFAFLKSQVSNSLLIQSPSPTIFSHLKPQLYLTIFPHDFSIWIKLAASSFEYRNLHDLQKVVEGDANMPKKCGRRHTRIENAYYPTHVATRCLWLALLYLHNIPIISFFDNAQMIKQKVVGLYRIWAAFLSSILFDKTQMIKQKNYQNFFFW